MKLFVNMSIWHFILTNYIKLMPECLTLDFIEPLNFRVFRLNNSYVNGNWIVCSLNIRAVEHNRNF